MARGFGIGDAVAITATVVTEDRVSVSIPSYNFPHSIIDHSKVKKGQPIELRGEITRIDDEGGRATIDLGTLVTVDIDNVRLVEKYRPPKRKKPLRDMVVD
ncbi:hypothetical protein [Mesorhizobium sp.]|jgi:hypothetical protein|uniref:hypothetical protein n=1 Tax=Mesorhizobium sp. TaxID=1871066 RepID=UPI0012051B94|nr:hypothetical protein [Mesorhizobium sp.]TIL35664.1 MAG: hypothetical protein E5Y85_06435 [Mesorhizobium sp.]TIL42477.1 MAG: hypothetical protein E5Y87_02675 [Mesorhizobium sp.]TIL45308.1 MAG: hypothetical protein E5Y86_12620 [Mesorhizobium sp.]TIL48156.1 MAG: hypothetical protein E5Y83_32460 [Mesorhizobium sp.]TIL59179.1 MAG: hypothetical protein E5Y79_15635 [Mesorhizobium sp.]